MYCCCLVMILIFSVPWTVIGTGAHTWWSPTGIRTLIRTVIRHRENTTVTSAIAAAVLVDPRRPKLRLGEGHYPARTRTTALSISTVAVETRTELSLVVMTTVKTRIELRPLGHRYYYRRLLLLHIRSLPVHKRLADD